MGKKFTKKVGAFDRETYETNQQAVNTLKAAGMSQISIAKTLKLSQSTVGAMVHKTYDEYKEYRKEKYAKRQAVLNGSKTTTHEPVPIEPKPDVANLIADRLASIDEKIGQIEIALEKIENKRRLF